MDNTTFTPALLALKRHKVEMCSETIQFLRQYARAGMDRQQAAMRIVANRCVRRGLLDEIAVGEAYIRRMPGKEQA